jgi:hypothetical protein
MMGRVIRTKLPSLYQIPDTVEHQQAKEKDLLAKLKQKKYADKHRRAKEQVVEIGDKVLLKQEKTTIKPPFDPEPFKVTEVRGTKVEAERVKDGKRRVRNVSKWKILKQRPAYLQPSRGSRKKEIEEEEEESDDEGYLSVEAIVRQGIDAPPPLDIQDIQDARPLPLPAQSFPTLDRPPSQGTPLDRPPSQGTPANRPKRNPNPIQRLGCEQPAGPSGSHIAKQLSPKEREKRKARQLARTNSKERWVMEPGQWIQTPKGWEKKEAGE